VARWFADRARRAGVPVDEIETTEVITGRFGRTKYQPTKRRGWTLRNGSMRPKQRAISGLGSKMDAVVFDDGSVSPEGSLNGFALIQMGQLLQLGT
jgi:hypothetical protein